MLYSGANEGGDDVQVAAIVTGSIVKEWCDGLVVP